MALTKISTGMLKADAASVDLNIDAGTLFLDVANNRIGIANTSPAAALHIGGSGHLLFERGGEVRSKDTGGSVRTIARIDGSNRLQYGWSGSGGVLFMGGGSYTERMRIHTNGNVGIGITNPGSLLTVEGDIRQTTGDLLYTGGGNWNLRHLVNNQNITFDTTAGGTTSEKMRVRADGNVGIGTTAPDNKLHVYKGNSGHTWSFDGGDGIILENSDSLSINIAVPAANSGNILFSDANARGQGRIAYEHSNDSMSFMTGGVSNERMRIDSSGNILIAKTNTTFSNTGIELRAGNGGSRFIRSNAEPVLLNRTASDGNILGIYKDGSEVGNLGSNSAGGVPVFDISAHSSSGIMRMLTSGSERMRIDASGNIGIGIASPTSKVDIRGAHGATHSRGQLYLSNTESHAINQGSQISLGGTYSGTNDTYFASISGRKENATSGNYAGYLQFATRGDSTNNAERMRITSTGNVGIGKTNPGTKLDVAGDIRALEAIYSEGSAPRVQLQDTDGTNQFSFFQQSSSQLSLRLRNDSADGSFRIAGYGGTTTTDRMIIGSTGDFSFYQDDGTTRMVHMDASSGRSMVGSIGNNVAIGRFHIVGNSDVNDEDCQLVITDVDGSSGSRIPSIRFTGYHNGSFLDQGRIRGTDTNGLVLSGSSTFGNDLVVQNTGIGIGAPSNTTFDSNITAYHATNAIKSLVKLWTNTADNTGTEGGAIEWVASGDKTAVGSKIAATRVANGGKMDLRFYTGRNTDANHEKMRINADGDWMVSNTVARVASQHNNQGGCGWYDADHHFEIATTSNRSALEVSKNNANDGELVTFRKQGNVVGRLGTFGTDLYIGQNDTGLRFEYAGLNAIVPFDADSVAISDGLIDLGHSQARFKNLTVSNAVQNTGGELYLIGSTNIRNRGAVHTWSNSAGSTEYGRFTSSGALLVGLSSTHASSSEKFLVYSTGGQHSRFVNSSDTFTTVYIKNTSTTANTNQPFLTFQDTGGNRGNFGLRYSTAQLVIQGHGGVGIAGGSGGITQDADLFVNSSGNVGIATTSPEAVLHVNGTVKLDGNYPGGTENLAFGNNALYTIHSSGNYNVAIGPESMVSTTTGDNNTALGYKTLYVNTTGAGNVAIGYTALDANTTGTENVAIGSYSMTDNNTGAGNVAVGRETLANNTSGTDNTALGKLAMYTNTSGGANVSVGTQSMRFTSTGGSNVAIGYYAMRDNTTQHYNVAVGREALRYGTNAGNSNVGVGYQAGYLTNAAGNVAVGFQALQQNASGDSNTAIGYQAGLNYTSSNATFIGYEAGESCTTGAQNVAIGRRSQQDTTTGASNTSVGTYSMLQNTTGSNNTALGYFALEDNTTGTQNVAIGQDSLKNITTNSYNTAIGASSGRNATGQRNTYLGFDAGGGVSHSGLGGIYVGMEATPGSATNNYEIVIGYATTGKGGQTGFINPVGGGVYQGNNSSAWSTTSDRRIKKNIVDNNSGLEKLMQVQVRNFEYRTEDEIEELPTHAAIQKDGVQLGVIAQEIQEVLPDVVKEETTGSLSVDPGNLTWYLINAVKELKTELDEAKAEIRALKGE